jgi:hypothetical protein
MILIVSDDWQLAFMGSDELLTGWDDDCPGLVATKAREAEWWKRQDHNDAEAARWAVEVPDGWGDVRTVSPIVEEGWPGIRPEDRGYPSEEGPLGPDSWPDLLLPLSGGVLVTTMTTVEKEGGHSACRLPIL